MSWLATNRTKIKLLLCITEQTHDDLIDEYIEQGVYDIVNYANLDSYDKQYDMLLRSYVVIKYNRRGVEGEISHSSNRVSRNYGGDPIRKLLASSISQNIRPTGYIYPDNRYELPE